MKLEILKKFGINRNDISAYEALLSLGRSKTGPIIKTSNISSSRVYESLQNLINKGLVSYQVKNNIKYYQSEPLTQLLEEAKVNTRKLESLTDEIVSYPLLHLDRNETNVYEGKHGFKMAFTQHVEGLRKGEITSIIGFSTRHGRPEELRTFLNHIEEMMMAKKCHSRILRDKTAKKILSRIQINKKHETRFLPTGYFSPMAVDISDREVMLSVWGDKPIVFTMRNPVIVESFKKNFEFLWGLAKKS